MKYEAIQKPSIYVGGWYVLEAERNASRRIVYQGNEAEARVIAFALNTLSSGMPLGTMNNNQFVAYDGPTEGI